MVVLILLAGLTSLSEEPDEAARDRRRQRLAALLVRDAAAGDADRHCRRPAAQHRCAEDLRHPLRHQGQGRRVLPRGGDAERLRLRAELRLQQIRPGLRRADHLLPDHHRPPCGSYTRRRKGSNHECHNGRTHAPNPGSRRRPPPEAADVAGLQGLPGRHADPRCAHLHRPAGRGCCWPPSRPTWTSTTPASPFLFTPTLENYANVLQPQQLLRLHLQQLLGGLRLHGACRWCWACRPPTR